ncbi:hypothetical protein HBI47_206040 [Parastagonospora nodorum]|nr:hypothetical protein HBI47_206040 [Parastagonospora nodorum]
MVLRLTLRPAVIYAGVMPSMDDKISTDRHAQIVRNQGEDIYARCMSAAKKRKFLTIGGRRMCCFQSESG